MPLIELDEYLLSWHAGQLGGMRVAVTRGEQRRYAKAATLQREIKTAADSWLGADWWHLER